MHRSSKKLTVLVTSNKTNLPKKETEKVPSPKKSAVTFHAKSFYTAGKESTTTSRQLPSRTITRPKSKDRPKEHLKTRRQTIVKEPKKVKNADENDRTLSRRSRRVRADKNYAEEESSDEGQPDKIEATKELKSASNSEEENSSESDNELSAYDRLRLKNIREREEMFKAFKISQAKEDLTTTLGLEKPEKSKTTKPSKRGLVSEDKNWEPAVPARKSLRLQKIEADKSFELPAREPARYSVPTVDDRPRPPLKELDLHEVVHWRVPEGEGLETTVQTKLSYLDSLGLQLESEFPENSSFSSDLSREIQSLRIREDQVAKVTPSRIFSLAVHPSEESLIVAAGDKWGVLGLWNVKDKTSRQNGVEVFYPHSRPINCMTFDSFAPNKLISTSYDGTVRRFDLMEKKFELLYGTAEDDSTYTGYHCQIDAHTFLVTLGSTGLVGLVDSRESNLTRARDIKVFERTSPKTVSVHPVDRNLFLCPNNKGSCCIFDLRSSKKTVFPVTMLTGHSRGISSAFFSPLSGKSVATVSYDDKIRIYDVSRHSHEISPKKEIKHNNQTGRWLTTFKAEWHPKRDDIFFVGSMKQPRQIDVYSDSGKHLPLAGEHLTSICSIVKSHATKNIIVGGNASGRLFVFM